MDYKEYINAYIQNKSIWWRVLTYKDIINDPPVLILFCVAVLFFILSFSSIILIGIDNYISSIVFLILCAISIFLLYASLLAKFGTILLCYEKENKPFFEYVFLPRKLYDTIPFKFNLYQDKKIIKFLIKRGNDFYQFNQYDVYSDIVTPQELSDSHSSDALKRQTQTIEKTSMREIIEKGSLFLVLGGMGFLIYILVTEILSRS
tara:strand:- start:5897 stop:6511 length:615 start_codon:yes stop_codon:yes gene_type:complete